MSRKILAIFLACGLLACSACGRSETGEAAAESETSAAVSAAETSPVSVTEAETEAEAVMEGVEAETAAISAAAADHVILFADGSVTLDGEAVKEYDYTWHSDPAGNYEEVKNAPGEYYTGEAPTGEEDVYIAHDIFYYPEIPESEFQKVKYDGETEWVTYYQDAAYSDYIYGTLPVLGKDLPAQMMHSAEEAYQNPVLHITAPGTYALSGSFKGQIWVDLGEDSFTDPEAVVTLLMNGVNVECTVAPAVCFYQVYECDNAWEDREVYAQSVDTSAAGARVIIADGTENYFSGTNIFRMLKTKLKDEEDTSAVPVQKKIRKTDGAFYSYMSMNIAGGEEGTGLLSITGGFEGLDSELHLTLLGGRIVIRSQDDGINVNEDGVSVLTVNGGDIRVIGGLGEEGDGIDSNGFINVNGGRLIATANPRSDSGMDSDCGSYVNGGTVVALGAAMDWAEKDDSQDSGQVTVNLRFSGSEDASEAISFISSDGTEVFRYCQAEDEAMSGNIRRYQGAIISDPSIREGETYQVLVGGMKQCYTGTDDLGGRGFGPGPGGFGRPEDFKGERPEKPEGFEGERPEGFEGDRPMRPEDFEERDFPGFGGHGERDGERPEMPPDMPEGFPGFDAKDASGESSTGFYMSDKVNSFSGVKDAT